MILQWYGNGKETAIMENCITNWILLTSQVNFLVKYFKYITMKIVPHLYKSNEWHGQR